jgi:hypothetical protein
LRSWTHFRRNRGRPFPFSCFALPDSLSAVPRASAPVHVMRSPACFRRCRGRRVPFSSFALPESFLVFMFCAPGLVFGDSEGVGSHFQVLRNRTHFWRYRGRRLPFSCFALPDSFSAQPRASAPVFMFCAPGLAFGGTEGVSSYTCFAHLNSFSAVPTASGPVFMF